MLKNSAIHTLSKGRKWSRRLMPVSDALLVRLMYRSKVSNKQNLTKTLLSEIQSRDTKWQDNYMLLPSINWLSFLFPLCLSFSNSLSFPLSSPYLSVYVTNTHTDTHTQKINLECYLILPFPVLNWMIAKFSLRIVEIMPVPPITCLILTLNKQRRENA